MRWRTGSSTGKVWADTVEAAAKSAAMSVKPIRIRIVILLLKRYVYLCGNLPAHRVPAAEKMGANAERLGG
jgi:hypothetical protein